MTSTAIFLPMEVARDILHAPAFVSKQPSAALLACDAFCVCVCVQGTTPSPYEAAAQLKKQRATEGVSDEQDWRWQVNKRQKVCPPLTHTALSCSCTNTGSMPLALCTLLCLSHGHSHWGCAPVPLALSFSSALCCPDAQPQPRLEAYCAIIAMYMYMFQSYAYILIECIYIYI